MVGIQSNGWCPRILISLIPFKAELMPSKGILIILFIPLIKALITAFKPFRIPSFMPSNTLPPDEKTFFTAVQALLNLSLNHSAIFPNAFFIPDHTFPKNSFTPFNENMFLIPFHALPNFSPNQDAMFLNTFSISFFCHRTMYQCLQIHFLCLLLHY